MALAALAAGIAIATLAAPRFNAAADRVAGDVAINRIATRQPVEPARLEAAERGRRAALRHAGDAATYGDLALLRLVQARRLPADSPVRAAALDEALALARAALQRDPGSSYLWMRLAETLVQKEGLGPAPVGALRRSLLTGPYLQAVAFPRLELAFLLESFLDGGTRELLRQQVAVMTGWMPGRVAEATRRRYRLKFVRETLAPDPPLLGRFDDAYDALR